LLLGRVPGRRHGSRRIDRHVPPAGSDVIDRDIARDCQQPRLLAAAALTLSGLGVYAVTSHVFAMRRREMGIRLALGSSRSSLYGLVFRHAFLLTGIGLVLGTGIAALGTTWLESLLFSTSPADSAAWSTMAGVVLLSTLLACAVPAWRVASTEPVSVLRD
jgi:putative ABC transport system permease protein